MLRWFFPNECLDLRVFDWQHTGNRYFALLVWMLTCFLCHQDLPDLRCSFISIKKKPLFPEWPPRWRRWRRGGGLGGGVRLPQVLTGAKTIIRWVPCTFGVGAIHTILFVLWFVLFCKLLQILKALYFLHNFDPTSFALICVFVLVLILFVFCSNKKSYSYFQMIGFRSTWHIKPGKAHLFQCCPFSWLINF